MTAAPDDVRSVVRLRTLGLPELDPPQTEAVDRLRGLAGDGPIAELDVGIWDGAVGITQTEHRDSGGTRETVAEFERWAGERDRTSRPAFERHAAESTNDGEDVRTVHDGVEALESMVGKTPNGRTPRARRLRSRQ